MKRIACYPAKSDIKIGYQFSPDYYDLTPLQEYGEKTDDDLCNPANFGEPILYSQDRSSLDRMEEMHQKYNPGSRPIHLTWNEKDTWGDIYTVMVPAGFKHGDPIYFNVENRKVEFV